MLGMVRLKLTALALAGAFIFATITWAIDKIS